MDFGFAAAGGLLFLFGGRIASGWFLLLANLIRIIQIVVITRKAVPRFEMCALANSNDLTFMIRSSNQSFT